MRLRIQKFQCSSNVEHRTTCKTEGKALLILLPQRPFCPSVWAPRRPFDSVQDVPVTLQRYYLHQTTIPVQEKRLHLSERSTCDLTQLARLGGAVSWGEAAPAKEELQKHPDCPVDQPRKSKHKHQDSKAIWFLRNTF